MLSPTTALTHTTQHNTTHYSASRTRTYSTDHLRAIHQLFLNTLTRSVPYDVVGVRTYKSRTLTRSVPGSYRDRGRWAVYTYGQLFIAHVILKKGKEGKEKGIGGRKKGGGMKESRRERRKEMEVGGKGGRREGELRGKEEGEFSESHKVGKGKESEVKQME